MRPQAIHSFLKSKASELGFLDCRIAKAEFLEEEAPRLENWLKKGFQADMHWMENNFDLRLDPTKLVPGAKSVVSLSYNYFPEDDALQKEAPKIALYAQGRDYHKVIKKKLKHLMGELQQQFGEIGGRAFVDSAPVHERAWAERSGLGWVGKNSLLLNKRAGSFFFLSELILDVDIEADTPVTDHCGSCTKCIDACPTEAIVGNKVIDSNKCISYLTIELKKEMTSEQEKMLNSWAFGCDICQEVCPWNRFSRPHEEPDFFPHPDIKEMKQKDWLELTEEVFEKRFGRTPLKRAGFKRFKENVRKSIQDRPKLL